MPLFTILTLFPEALEAYLSVGILGLARQRGLVEVHAINFRDWARDRHRTVDDRPFGGGPGMVLKPEPIVECVEWIEERYGPHRRLALCPSGQPFVQADAEQLARADRTLLLCGRYEGFDERIHTVLGFDRVSLGDFVLAGGELPALCIVEAAVRLLPGALGDDRSALEDSFADGETLDHPHFTRPRVYRGHAVPDVLFSGNHDAIARWRQAQAAERTAARADPPHGSTEPTEHPRDSSQDTTTEAP